MYEAIKDALKDVTTEKETRKILRELDISYDDVSKEYGYMNFMIPMNDGSYIRIYRRKNRYHPRKHEIAVQRLQPIDMTYSGVPTFMPSGRDTFGDWF